MTHYTRDIKHERAIKLVSELSNEGKDELIKYYIEKQNQHIKQLQDRIDEYV
jgi:hypothetical protein